MAFQEEPCLRGKEGAEKIDDGRVGEIYGPDGPKPGPSKVFVIIDRGREIVGFVHGDDEDSARLAAKWIGGDYQEVPMVVAQFTLVTTYKDGSVSDLEVLHPVEELVSQNGQWAEAGTKERALELLRGNYVPD